MDVVRTCPVCRARWRGSVTCSRCGSDLAPLMRLALAAWRLRRDARAAAARGDWAAAHTAALESLRLEATPHARRLVAVLGSGPVFPPRDGRS